MKTNRFRLLTVLLTAVMLVALSLNVMAAKSNAVKKDGLTAQLFTDKDSYKAGETVQASVQVDNHTGREVFIFTQINVPEGVKLAGDNTAFDIRLQDGESWNTLGGGITQSTGGIPSTAGSNVSTGDNMQAGFYVILTVLAVGGIFALLVYGKNRKTRLSVLLCMAMVAGMAVAAVPAQAADMNGDIYLSCMVQMDGKDIEISAQVSYVIYDEAEEETGEATSAPTETPEATEAPAPTETPEATEAPTETPEATEAPTQTPEATEAPSEEPEETPVESNYPEETGYYVVWDDFTFTNSTGDPMFSSWDIALPQGYPSKAADGMALLDASEYAKAQALRAFNAITEDFTLEFSMRATEGMENMILDIKNEDITAIHFTAIGDKLYMGSEELCALPTDKLANLKLHICPSESIYTISIDGATIMDGNGAKEFSFQNSTDAIDRLYIETGAEDMGQIIIGTVRVYVGFYVNEKFLDGTNGTINDEWTVTGDAATIYKQGTQGPDNYSVLLKDGAGITRDAVYEQDGAWVEYQHLMEDNTGEFVMTLLDEAGKEFKVATVNGTFGYYNGEEFVGLYDCMNNLWYHVMLKQTEEGTELYLNHKLKAENITLPFEKFTHIAFAAKGGETLLDDIIVKDYVPLPEDYVPTPIAVEKDEDAALVGVQSCNLWVEGEHFGYDWLTDWEDRTPVLGYYDEILPEVADWELKFKVEHGIDFELFCWYRPIGGNDEPIKMARNARTLHDGYMNAEYSDMMKFAITWESGSSVSGIEDFKENVIPYWMEQYFKDDRYLVIDNKPVVGMYNISKLKDYFGSIEGVKDAVEALREACVKAGFDGAYVIMCNSSADSAVEISTAGFDGQYAYSWGDTSYNVNTQIKGMQGVQSALEEARQAANGVVPTASQGRWSKAWNRDDGKYCTIEDFEEVLTWIRDEFMPELDENSIGSKMMLLDNWNEYGEGHFIMPAKLAGFDYLDAVREVFGDGDGIGGEHTVNDIVPTEKQLARINHMYVQDRHVVLVDKDADNGNLETIEGYNWTFEVDEDTEGWTVGSSDGKWIKDLSEWYVKNGEFYGKTYTPDELAEKVTNGIYPEGATADPSILSPDNLNLNANEAIAIKVVMRGVGGVKAVGNPKIYFTTTEDTKYTSAKVVSATYAENDSGNTEVMFYMNTCSFWTGTIKQLRLDPIQNDGEFWIDSVQIMKRKDSGAAEVYLEGERIYTSSPIQIEGSSYMYPVDELSSIINAHVIETLEKDKLIISTDTALFEFPYEGETKLLANGSPVDSVGAVSIDNQTYVPIVDILKNIGSVTDSLGNPHPAYEVEVTQASGNVKAKILIKKYVDASILKAYYFTSGTEAWTYGGTNVTKTPATNGVGAIEIAANGSEAKFWSPRADGEFNVNAQKADHIRMRVKTDASTIKVVVYGDSTSFSYTYNSIHLTDNMLAEDGFYEVTIDLANAQDALRTASELDRVCIYWYDAEAGGTQTFAMDSFEILDLVEDDAEEENDASTVIIEESPYTIYDWDFRLSSGSWVGAGATIAEHNSEKEALKVTAAGGAMNVWSSAETDGVISKPVGISTAEATHVLVRVETAEVLSTMGLEVQYLGTDGKQCGSVSYTGIAYETDVNGNLYALVDLSSSADWETDQTIASINIYPIGQSVTEADNGKTVHITSVEILDKSWFIEFDSTYFTNSTDEWIVGGYTQIANKQAALAVSRSTVETDYNPRIWSMGATNGIPKTPYEYSIEDVTHIRVRLRADIPETLPDTMTDQEKAALEEITSVTALLRLKFSDGTDAGTKTASYEVGTEDYVTITFDIQDIYKEAKTLGRIGLEVYQGGNEYLCKAGTTVMIDSVQFLRKINTTEEAQPLKVLIIGNSITKHAPSKSLGWVGDWGMAASSEDKDYVHLLEAKILEKNDAVEVKAINISQYEKYFYDWSLISDTKDKYANWNADIIIAAFGANVKNGSNENDSSYENDYIFTADKYKKIIDKFNPDGDAKVIAGTTILTNANIVNIIKNAAETYGYTYVDMTEWTADEYRAYGQEQHFIDLFKAQYPNEEVPTDGIKATLGHPGDSGMQMIAEELWTALNGWIPTAEASYDYRIEYYYDNVVDETKTVSGKAEEGATISSYSGKDEGGYVLDKVEGLPLTINATGENVAKVYYKKSSIPEGYDIVGSGYYFKESKEDWKYGGTTGLSNAADKLVVTSPTAENDYKPRIFSPVIFEQDYSNGDITHIRIRIKTSATTTDVQETTLRVQLRATENNETVTIMNLDQTYKVGTNEYVELLIACNGEWKEEIVLKDIGLYPFSSSGNEALAKDNVTVYIDSVELLKEKAEATETPEEEENKTEYETVKSYEFKTDKEGWSFGGSVTFDYDSTATAITASSENGVMKIKSPDNLGLEGVTHIRVKLKTNANVSATMYVENTSTHTGSNSSWTETRAGNVSYQTDENGNAEIVIDCSTLIATNNSNCVKAEPLKQVILYPFGDTANDSFKNVMVYIDSVELLKVKSTE